MQKYLVAAFSLAAVVTLGMVLDSSSKSAMPAARPRQAPPRISTLGRVEGATPEIELRPQIAGRVVEVSVREGQQVEAGQTLVRLDDDDANHQLDVAGAELELAQAQLEQLVNGPRQQEKQEAEFLYQSRMADVRRSQQRWSRIKTLQETRSVTQQEADDLAAELDSLIAQADAARVRRELLEEGTRPELLRIARARVAVAEHRLAQARTDLERTRLAAPSAGTVLHVDCETGELVGPDASVPTIVLVDTTRLFVRAFVDEADAPRLVVGMNANVVTDGLPGHVFTGRVSRLSPRMDSKRVFSDQAAERLDSKVREAWIELDEPAGLIVGLRVDVTLGLDP